MNVTFINGSAYQQEVVLRALGSLLHLDLDRFTFDAEIEFVANPDPNIHNEFATTEGPPILIQLREDFPHFAPQALWGDIRFANETVIHELGHALLRVLETSVLASILELFDATIEDYDSDDERAWENRVREGIAETFKDAFLPNSLRLHANRTNVKLPITKYPDFRAIFRSGLAGGGRFCYLYGSASFRVEDEWELGRPIHQSDNDDIAFVHFRDFIDPTGWGVDMSQFTESGEMMYTIHRLGGDT